MESARLIIEVTAGLIPGQAMPEYTQAWAVTSKEFYEAQSQGHEGELITSRANLADVYAKSLRNPARLNWVRTDWVWL